MTIKLDTYLEPYDETGKKRSYSEFFYSAKDQLGITTQELAEALGCKASRISEYLYGKRVKHPGLMLLGKIKRMIEGENR